MHFFRSQLKRIKWLVKIVHAVRFGRWWAVDRFVKAKLLVRSPIVWLQKSETGPVVCLTSFPGRLAFVWASIESIFQQGCKPRRIVLVLSELQFPGRRLPLLIRWQQWRGLEILWTVDDKKSFKKLIPFISSDSPCDVITIDDDAIYYKGLIDSLNRGLKEYSGDVVGFRGWNINWEGSTPADYLRFPRAPSHMPGEDILLTGVGGIAYPASVFDVSDLTAYSLAKELCPTADDIWFWAALRNSGYRFVSLDKRSYRENFSTRRTSKLADVNLDKGCNNAALRAVTEYFGLRSGAEMMER